MNQLSASEVNAPLLAGIPADAIPLDMEAIVKLAVQAAFAELAPGSNALPFSQPAGSNSNVKPIQPRITHWDVILQPTAGTDGGKDVFVGAQGKGFLIKRGVVARVPPIVKNILDIAVGQRYTYSPDGTQFIPHDVYEVPFTATPVFG